MVTQPQSPARLAFGPFEVNPAAEELLRGGVRIRLSGQPFQILMMLLARPGEVVTREELRDQIWSEGTFVDFEHGLNAAMNKLRRTLGDAAENPRYIETIPGRGYRFIGVVTPPAANGSSRAAAEGARRGLVARWSWLGWVAVPISAVLGVMVTWWVIGMLRPKAAVTRPVQFVIASPAGAFFSPPISRQSFAISPDGTRLAFTVADTNGTRVWIRDLSSLELRQVAGTDGAWTVFWSPDSRSVFFSVKKVLRQVNVETGATRDVATLPWMVMDGTWRYGAGNGDGEDLLYLWSGATAAYEVSAKTGTTRPITVKGFRWAQFLPDGRHYLHVDFDASIERYHAVLTDYATGTSAVLLETDSRVEYAPPRKEGGPGHLLFVRDGSLMAQGFDTERLQLVGDPQQLAQNIVYFRPSASACFSVSDNGVLVYQSGLPVSELQWYDRGGKVVSSTKQMPFSGTVRISPDGRRAAADVWTPASGVRDVWVFAEDGASRRLTFPNPPTTHVRPVWSPDGGRIAFGVSDTSSPRLAAVSTDESAKEAMLVSGDAGKQPDGALQIPTDWSRDGRYIAYDTSLGEEEREVWLMDVSAGKIMPLLKNGSSQWGAAFSPDAREIAFVSDESGVAEVYEQGFAAEPTPHLVGEKRQVSHGGGWLVRWRPDGHELFYVGVDARLYAVPVERGVVDGDAKALFQVPGQPQYGTPTDVQFDVAPGGQRFAVTTAATAVPRPFVVVQNWQEMLTR